MMHEHIKIMNSKCPKCDCKMDSLTGEDMNFGKGSIIVCGICGTINQLTEDLKLIPKPIDELTNIDSDTAEQLSEYLKVVDFEIKIKKVESRLGSLQHRINFMMKKSKSDPNYYLEQRELIINFVRKFEGLRMWIFFNRM